ncbi:Phosphatidylserine decarboxylase proenzyme [uncultured Alphaproteobacteria bacterium]|uniref:Phosphatidylserine decarboxylase proenzyme n=1 Tax=uncultured Alphaproteobacteria bacterium TaxID=91750 RepID=A0A212JNI9_9PROT|nr:Phosphatidylserine decarboxylase proenzyme [uncultured Alphaproteobacteria bacterium]
MSGMSTVDLSWRRYVAPPIHPEGYKFIAIFAVIAALLWLAWEPLGVIGAALTVWCFYFFRNPERVTPVGDHWVVSPADGMVQSVVSVTPPPELELGEGERTRISVFMSVFDVHVNRAPTAGSVGVVAYAAGKFVNATLDKASLDNERNSLRIDLPDRAGLVGGSLGVVQIAGLIARRIVCFVKVGDTLDGGERFGLIRFGSRLDVYLPPGVAPMVAEGQKAIAGETVLADLRLAAGAEPRRGESR